MAVERQGEIGQGGLTAPLSPREREELFQKPESRDQLYPQGFAPEPSPLPPAGAHTNLNIGMLLATDPAAAYAALKEGKKRKLGR